MAKQTNSDPSAALRKIMKVMDKQKVALSGMLNSTHPSVHSPLISALRNVVQARSAVNQAVEAFERDSIESLLSRYVDDAAVGIETDS